MLKLKLNKSTRANVEKCVGEQFDVIIMATPGSEERVVKKNIVFSKTRDLRKIGRGNPLLSRRRIRTIDEINEMLKRIK